MSVGVKILEILGKKLCVTPLSKCTSLEDLNISYNEIENASPLGALINLRYFTCQKSE